MKKRIIAFLLAFLLAVDMLSGSVFATMDTTDPMEITDVQTVPATNPDESITLADSSEPSESTTPTESSEPGEGTAPDNNTDPADPAEPAGNNDVSAVSEAALFCAYCEAAMAEDGTAIHAEDCNTNFAVNASGDIGKTATFSMAFGDLLYTNQKPTVDFNYDPTSEGYGFSQTSYDPDDPAFVEIIDWCWEVSGPTLWYRVQPLAGETLPEGLTGESWILQRYTNDPAPMDTLIFADAGMIGTYVRFRYGTAVLYETLTDAYYEENAFPVDGNALSAMVVKDLFTDGSTTWYYVDAAEGEIWPESYGDCHYVPARDMTLCEVCPVCGKPSCTTDHPKCDVCGEYNCREVHLFCLACSKFLCGKTHTYCGYCDAYDCTIDHLANNRPDTTPSLPENPILPEGVEVAILDAQGNHLTDGLMLSEGCRVSISAWSADIENAAFQWQIRYDSKNDLWSNIQGADKQGILVSPAMFRSILELQDTTAIRCVMTVGEESKTSAAIPVGVQSDISMAYSLSFGSESAIVAAEQPDTLENAHVFVQYVYADGRTASQSEHSTIIPGKSHDFTYAVPSIPGYMATLKNATSVKDHAVLTKDGLKVTYAAGELAANTYTIFTVEYVPDFVDVTVIHFRQNVDNDNYTEYERETVSGKYKTGQQVSGVHKDKGSAENPNPNYDPDYDGFYSLLYETPAAAADGSTVIEVYYDRYYYLMKFNLGDMGYGVDPIYARFGAEIEIGTPTRAGYTFAGWKLNGTGDTITAANMPTTMPAENQTYEAQWQSANTTQLTVMYWGENPNDDNYSVIESRELTVNAGITLNYTPSHIHSSTCYGANSNHTSLQGHDIDLYQHIKPQADFKSGYVYVTYNNSGGKWPYLYLDGKWYSTTNATYNFDDTDGEITNYTATNGQTLNARRCKAILTCSESGCSCSDPYHAAGEACGLEIDLDDKIWTFERSPAVTVQPDGSSVLNVYFTRKEYTLRFYYAASANKKSENTGNDITYYVVGGSTYHFGGANNDDEIASLNTYFGSTASSSAKTEVGEVKNKPTLKVNNPKYTEGQVESAANGYTYYYISFTAKYGANIYQDWPTDVFNNVYCYTPDWSKSNFAFASAWNGEHHVYYTRHNTNQTIKGKYSVLDDNLLWDYSQFGAYAEVETDDDGKTHNVVDFLCFWENGADTTNNWSIPGLFRYHIYVKPYEGMDTTDLVPGTWNGTVYYCIDHYDTIDDSDPKSQTYPEIEGYVQLPDYFVKDAEGKAIDGTFYANGMSSFDTDLYNKAYDVYFYYERQKYDLTFYNGNRVEKTHKVEFDRPLAEFNYTPSYPVDANGNPIYEADSRTFTGWYTNAAFQGDPVNLATLSMKAKNLMLYAQWEPVSYTVNYYLTRDSLTRGENIPTEMARLVQEAGIAPPADDPYTETFATDTVKHGAYIPNLSEPEVAKGYEDIHPRTGFEFIGWFYLNEDGEETAFDPENIAVTQNLDLYAKWSANKLCHYNVYFALDAKNNETGAEGPDGIADVDADGNIIQIADPISGSGIAGRTYTFTAKGGEELKTGYQEGYFPNTGSHSLVINIADEEGTGANSFTFLYTPKNAVPYTVRYIDKDTDAVLRADKVVGDNKNVIVTENYQYVQGYMPDAYQKTLVVTDDNDPDNDVLIFYYTKDEQHSLYVVNYYIEELNADLSRKGWSRYTFEQSPGDIGKDYSANAITIDGFTLSVKDTDQYNVTDKKNGMDGTTLPTDVSKLADGKISGQLTGQVMQLNFYYTRNLYPYEFRYMLNGTTTKLAPSEFGKAAFDTDVIEAAKTIKMDLDEDGVDEDYQLYDAAESSKTIHIKVDGNPLTSTAEVTEGQAKVNVATFYYVRCTQTMTIKKTVADNSNGYGPGPDPDQEFRFALKIYANNYHRTNYNYTKSDGSAGTLSPEVSAPTTLQFTLKQNQTITIEGLPTAEYALTELDLPTGYYDTYTVPQENGRYRLTVDEPVAITVTNTYEPANLTVSKTVSVVEEPGNIPEVENFQFTIQGPEEFDGYYLYYLTPIYSSSTTLPVENRLHATNGTATFTLKKDQQIRIQNLPVGNYTVTETDYSANGYNSEHSINGVAPQTQGLNAQVTLARRKTQTVDFVNRFPVGDLMIEKAVTKEFLGTAWTGDTFTFTVERTTANRPLVIGNRYKVLIDGVPQADPIWVDGNHRLTVTIPFSQEEAAALTDDNRTINKVLTIQNLPAGTYLVTETENADYIQTPDSRTVSGLELPAENDVKASFTNTVRRKNGSLYLEKELVPASGYNPDELPTDTKFSFTVALLNGIPTSERNITLRYSSAQYTDGTATPASVTMSGDKFTIILEAGWDVTMSGLPEGKYRITEATIPSYANNFAHRENGTWVEQESKTTTEGQMYTEIDVKPEVPAEVKCTNTYPVNRAELIIQKLPVEKQYEWDPAPGSFTFTVTLEEEDAESYSYKIYDANNDPVGDTRTATVTGKVFSITLEAGQYAVIPDMPVCGYTVAETVDTGKFSTSYSVYVSETGESASTTVNSTGAIDASGTGISVSRTFSAGKTDAIVFTNAYRYATLTIRRSEAEADQVFVYEVQEIVDNNPTGNCITVTVTGNSSTTIHGLIPGTYTVTQKNNWSWRYGDADAVQTVSLPAGDTDVTFINSVANDSWLDGNSAVKKNVYGQAGG